MTAQRADELMFTEVLPIGTPEERAMAEAFKTGVPDAYRAIHDRYAARVHSVCRRMLHNPDDAAEAAQETFLRVYQGLGTFNGRYRLGAWVVRIATNVCLDQIRSRTRRPSDPTPLEVLELESAPLDDSDPELVFLRHAEGRKVRKILASLPPMHRAAIVLRDFEGISYAEIAETLGITECQVKALLHRARRGFRKHWTSNLASVFAPVGLVKRFFRPVRGNASQHLTSVSPAAESAVSTSQSLTSTAAQAFQTCSGMIQGCGQFLADKAAPVVTAVVVGTATVGAAAIKDRDARQEPREEAKQVASVVDAHVGGRESHTRSSPRIMGRLVVKNKPSTTSPAPLVEAPSTVAPVPEPVPSPVPPPDQAPGEPGPGTTPETPPPAPPAPPVVPEPQDFTFSFISDMAGDGDPCACIPTETQVVQSKIVVVEQQGLVSLDHLARAPAVAAGTPFYGLELRQIINGGRNHRMEFFLQRPEGMFRYMAAGTLTEKVRTDWGGWTYRYSGTYRLYSRPGGSELMPVDGSYTAELTSSWRQNRVVSSTVSLVESKR